MHTATRLSRTSLALAALVAVSLGFARAQSEPPPGLWRERQPLPGWVVVRTPSYEVQAEIGEPRAHRLADFLQGLRPHFEALWPARPRAERLVVKVFATRERRDAWLEARELWADEPPPGTPPSCAVHEPFSRDILAFDSGRLLDDTTGAPSVGLGSDRSISLPHAELQRLYPLLEAVTAAYTPDLARDVGHEAWHQYLDAATLSRPPLPAWLDEGLADWLAAATPGGRPWTLRDPSAAGANEPIRPGALHEDRLRDVLRARHDGQTLPLRDLLVRITRLASAEPPGLLAQGWSVVQFLQTSADPTNRRLILALVDGIRTSEDGASPAEDVLKGLDLRALDHAWGEWLASQQPIDPLADLARESGGKVSADDLLASPWIKECYAWHRRNPAKPARGGAR
jgi:hypothetical protein